MKTKNTKNKSKKIKIMCIYILVAIGIITPLIAIPLAIHIKNTSKTLEKHATNLQKLLNNKIFEVKDKQILNSNWKINKTLQLVEINNIIKKTLPNINNNLKIIFKITQIIKTNSIQIQAIITFNEDLTQKKLATFTIKGFYNPIKIYNQVIQKAFEKVQTSKTLIIPNGITSDQFNDYVNNHPSFENDYKNIITSITFPNSFTYINNWFQSFPLISLILGTGLQTIRDFAFQSAKLETLAIPNTVIQIAKSAFEKSPLKSLKLGTALQTIEHKAFYYAELQKLVIPNAVTQIGVGAFENSFLESLTLGTKLQTIGNFAFYESGLQELVIPNTIIQIGKEAFYNSPLESLILGTNLQTIGNWAFYGAELQKLIIPNIVTEIGKEAFKDSPLTSLTLGSGLQAIGRSAFISAKLESFTNSNISIKDASQTKVASSVLEEDIILPTSSNPKITFKIKSIKESIKTPGGTTVTIELEVLFNDNIIKLYNIELSGFDTPS